MQVASLQMAVVEGIRPKILNGRRRKFGESVGTCGSYGRPVPWSESIIVCAMWSCSTRLLAVHVYLLLLKTDEILIGQGGHWLDTLEEEFAVA